VVCVVETAGEVGEKITVEATDLRRVERAVADMRVAFERVAELRDLIEVHGADTHRDAAS
jgi:hypothetical protein